MSKSWFSIQAKAEDPAQAEVSIHAEIGGWGIMARDFIRDLRALGPVSQIDLSIHSPGGSVFEGWAVYNALQNHDAQINVRIEGLAASMASVIAMAGDTITMPENSYMMIHDPWGFAMGGAEDMRKNADLLDKLKANIVNVYAERTGIAVEHIEMMMADETWMDGKEAAELGFADEVTGKVEMAAHFDLSRYRNCPLVDTTENPTTKTMGLFKKDDDMQAKAAELQERLSALEAELTEANEIAAVAAEKVNELQAAVTSAVQRAEAAEKDVEQKQERIQELEAAQSDFEAKVAEAAAAQVAALGHPPVPDADPINEHSSPEVSGIRARVNADSRRELADRNRRYAEAAKPAAAV